MKLLFLTILSLTIANSSFTQAQISSHENDLLTEFMRASFDALNDKENIPKPFLKYLNKNRKEKIIFANPEESFDPSNLGAKNAPNAKIVFLGKSADELYVLLYDAAGYSVSRKAFIFALVGKGVVMKEFILNSSVNGVADMKRIFNR